MNESKFKNGILNFVDFPKDVLLNLPKITLIGKTQLTIENHRGIIEYIPERIRVNTSIGILKVGGKKMVINSIMIEFIVISGEISNIEMLT